MNRLEMVRIVVVEELPLLCEALALLCSRLTGGEVVAQSSDGAIVYEHIQRHQPDIALLDLALPNLSTFEIVRRLQVEKVPTRIVVLAVRRDRRTVMEALRCGVAGYVLKSAAPEELQEAFREVLRGGIYIVPELEIGRMFSTGPHRQTAGPIDRLSSREFQVFTMLVEGTRAKEIAARLALSPKTVDTYRASLMRKLEIHDVAGLVKFAMRNEMLAGI